MADAVTTEISSSPQAEANAALARDWYKMIGSYLPKQQNGPIRSIRIGSVMIKDETLGEKHDASLVFLGVHPQLGEGEYRAKLTIDPYNPPTDTIDFLFLPYQQSKGQVQNIKIDSGEFVQEMKKALGNKRTNITSSGDTTGKIQEIGDLLEKAG